MSKRFKDFGSDFGVTKEPIVFKVYDEEFTCRPSLPGRTLLRLVSTGSSEDPSEIAETIETFFEVCLVEESKERFNALLEDPDKVVPVDTLADIAAWLVEEYSGRPTEGPEDSQSGQ